MRKFKVYLAQKIVLFLNNNAISQKRKDGGIDVDISKLNYFGKISLKLFRP